ncbi:MAG: hypothetical protein JO029_04765 [Candidatus Eremiobacteraeota bacterium]|nr:hypothetical protein [Candidatus Eremiobacteraeota bacterium]
MSKFVSVLVKEFKELLPPTIFFFVALHLVAFIRSLLEVGSLDVSAVNTTSIFIGSLILGKAVLLADLLPFINRYPEKPLAYNIVWKTAIYFVMATGIHYLERVLENWKSAGSFTAANERMLAEIIWPHFWGIQIILLILVVGYVSFHEISRVLGLDIVRTLFFGKLPEQSRVKDIGPIHISVEGRTD